MTSTSTSKKDDPILELKNFGAAYRVSLYNQRSLRDLFIQTIKHPLDTLLNEPERLLVLKDISFSVKKGERVALIGNNGCGKTTLCRYISGIYGKSSTIKINGETRSIFDTEVSILPELSGKENLEVLTHLFFPKLSKQERNQIIEESIEFAEIGKFADAPYKLYSKGMRARLCLSLISARPTDLLILDEVFNGADHFFNEKITKRVKKLIYDSGAVIFVSHSFELLKEVCNRAIVLDGKKIVFDGQPEEAHQYYLQHCNRTKIENA